MRGACLLAVLVVVVGAGAAHADPDPATAGTLTGLVLDDKTAERLAGATIVAEALDGPKRQEEVQITDETGAWTLTLVPGAYRVIVYFGDSTVVAAERVEVVLGEQRALPAVKVHDEQVIGCVFWTTPPAGLIAMPHFGLSITRDDTWRSAPVVRDRTVRAWIAPLVSANAATSVQSVADAPRFARAPGIPLAFVSTVTTSTLRTSIMEGAGSGGDAQVELRSGSNEVKGDARVVLGLDGGDANRSGASAQAEAFLGGPLVHDHAWLAGGLVGARGADGELRGSGMLAADYMPGSDHQLSVVGIAQDEDDARDQWARARWTSKIDENRLQIDAMAVGERLETAPGALEIGDPPGSVVTTRAGGALDAFWRKKGAGYHTFKLLASGGAGSRGGVGHDDASAALGDDWQMTPALELEVGARVESRGYARDRETLVVPRASLTWDPTKEARSELFVAYQRVPRLDDGLPGDWRTLATAGTALFYDELAAGAEYETTDDHPVIFGTAVRARTHQDALADRVGAEAWVHYQRDRAVVHAAATSLGKIASIRAGVTLAGEQNRPTLRLLGSLQASPDATDGGMGLAYHHGTRKLAVDAQLEAFEGTAGPGGRFVVGASW